MASATFATSTLPHLSARDTALLQAYFSARCDIFVMAEKQSLSVLDLLAWASSPAVAAHTAALKRLVDDSITLRTAQARLLSLDTLERIVKTTDDPIELRRAASTIYRGGAAMPQPRPPKKPDPDNPPPRYLPRKYHRDSFAQSPGFHPPYIPPRPTAHDSYSRSGARSSTHSRSLRAESQAPRAPQNPLRPEGARSWPGALRGSASKPLVNHLGKPRPGGPTRRPRQAPSITSRSARTSVPPAAVRGGPRPARSRSRKRAPP